MWLTGRLAPDFKTIADFRHDNPAGIRNVFRRFVSICRQLKLLSQGVVAVDGSKFKAVNNRDRNFTPHKLAKRMQQVDESIARYMDALDTADRTQPLDLQARTSRLQDKLVKLRKQMQHLREIEIELAKQPDQQLSQTDPDARSMATSGRGTGMVGYNVQVAADTKHHLIVATEVINEGHDRGSLWSMAQHSREALGKDKIELIADQGYFKGPEILACEQAGIKTYVPKPMTSNSKAEGRFSKADFIYIARDDEYQCPAGERLRRHQSNVENGMRIDTYWTYICPHCPIKAQCTTGHERRVRRWEHEAVLDTMQARLDRKPDAMKIRRRTIEHVFGTLKHWMGSAHFLMKTLAHVPTEVNLHALAYNLKRVISVLGIAKTMKAMKLAGA
jgi:Transposase DDE domain